MNTGNMDHHYQDMAVSETVDRHKVVMRLHCNGRDARYVKQNEGESKQTSGERNMTDESREILVESNHMTVDEIYSSSSKTLRQAGKTKDQRRQQKNKTWYQISPKLWIRWRWTVTRIEGNMKA